MSLLVDVKRIVAQILSNPEIGRQVTVIRVTDSVTDPIAGTVTKTTTEVPANSYFDAINVYNAPAGSTIEATDVLAYLDQEVQQEDQVDRDGVIWNVINVNPVELGGGTAIWIAQLRR